MSLYEESFSLSRSFDCAKEGSVLSKAKLLFVNEERAVEPKIKPKFFIKFRRS